MPVPAEGEKDVLFLPRFPTFKGLIDDHLDGVGWLWGGDDALGAGELHRALENGDLILGAGFDEAKLVQVADDGGHPVVAESPGVDWGWDEGMPQGVHQGDRCHASDVAVVPGIGALGDRGAGLGLNVDDLQVGLSAFNFVLNKGQEHPSEV